MTELSHADKLRMSLEDEMSIYFDIEDDIDYDKAFIKINATIDYFENIPSDASLAPFTKDDVIEAMTSCELYDVPIDDVWDAEFSLFRDNKEALICFYVSEWESEDRGELIGVLRMVTLDVFKQHCDFILYEYEHNGKKYTIKIVD